jgi:hypothetical protein
MRGFSALISISKKWLLKYEEITSNYLEYNDSNNKIWPDIRDWFDTGGVKISRTTYHPLHLVENTLWGEQNRKILITSIL